MSDQPPPPDSPLDPTESSERESVSIYEKLARLDVSGKVKAALLGSREEREILIRESNRLVYTAVLQSPKLTIQEVEKIANMKNISDDILRIISEKRDWVSNYSVILALVRNPRTPIPSSIKFIPRLQDRDLRFLSKDKTVPEPVRKMAKQLAMAKKL
ncbi:MAG TPA: hypothetical protein VGL91_14700 [Acidobacteriota bacterium]|jgi:hypothetical protein